MKVVVFFPSLALFFPSKNTQVHFTSFLQFFQTRLGSSYSWALSLREFDQVLISFAQVLTLIHSLISLELATCQCCVCELSLTYFFHLLCRTFCKETCLRVGGAAPAIAQDFGPSTGNSDPERNKGIPMNSNLVQQIKTAPCSLLLLYF